MKQSDVVIRPMQEDDVPQIAQLEQLCFSLPWSENCVRSELTNPLSLWLVAAVDDAVAGYIGSQTVLGEADIMNVAVAPQFRRCGIGETLLLQLEQKLKAEGVYSLTLEVRATNEAALCLYEKLGYTIAGRRPNYYQKPKEDALILRKEWKV